MGCLAVSSTSFFSSPGEGGEEEEEEEAVMNLAKVEWKQKGGGSSCPFHSSIQPPLSTFTVQHIHTHTHTHTYTQTSWGQWKQWNTCPDLDGGWVVSLTLWWLGHFSCISLPLPLPLSLSLLVWCSCPAVMTLHTVCAQRGRPYCCMYRLLVPALYATQCCLTAWTTRIHEIKFHFRTGHYWRHCMHSNGRRDLLFRRFSRILTSFF